MAEGGALQTGWLRRQGLCLQLEGVAEGPGAQAVQGLDADPAGVGGNCRGQTGCIMTGGLQS